jgi:drug/metabolite transporter (DMT)-like permease
MSRNSNISIKRGILFMLCAMFIFTFLNVLIKDAAKSYDPLQVVFFRCLFAVLPSGLYLMFRGEWKLPKLFEWKIHGCRAFLLAGGLYLLFRGIAELPLSNSIALYFSTTFFLVVLSYPILREKVSLFQWAAVILGFVGVMIIAKPGWSVFYWGTIFMILGASLESAHNLFGRLLSSTQDSFMLTFLGSLLPATILLFGLPFVWVTPNLNEWIALMGLGIGGGLGQLCLSCAYQHATAGVLAPMVYSALLWSVLLDIFLYSNWPEISLILGCTVIIVAGLIIVYFESQREVAL